MFLICDIPIFSLNLFYTYYLFFEICLICFGYFWLMLIVNVHGDVGKLSWNESGTIMNNPYSFSREVVIFYRVLVSCEFRKSETFGNVGHDAVAVSEWCLLANGFS